jgi:flagellum-specific ATP synthase
MEPGNTLVNIENLLDQISTYQTNLAGYDDSPVACGKLVRVVGIMLEAAGCKASLGGLCRVQGEDSAYVDAEVVGFEGERVFLMPITQVGKVKPGAHVVPLNTSNEVGVGEQLLGRVIDGAGRPLDDKGDLDCTDHVSLHQEIINPLQRKPITEVLDVGIGAINALTTVGRGQRLGIFAESGVGKSVLLGMMTKYTKADVTVVALVGERGREVKEFIENILDSDGLSHAVIVASPADDSPSMKLRAATLATRIAEYFRDQNKEVLLLMDSLTRFAQAQRQIALAVGEPPSTKGYPPSVFAKIPQLVERAGNAGSDKGSITAFYTILTEGDDQQDPVADAARAILDGHIVMSKKLAESGCFPAIDVEASVSRLMPVLAPSTHLDNMRKFRQIYSTYRQNEDLINVGAYTPGSDPQLDVAIKRFPAMQAYLGQQMDEKVELAESWQQLEALLSAELT